MQGPEKIAIWEEHMLKAANFSGSTMSYCHENGISKSQFGYWKNRLKELKEKSLEASREKISNFIPVGIRPSPAAKKANLPEAKWVAEFLVYFMNAAK